MIENEFIEFENNSKVLDYRYQYKDLPIYPYIRDFLARRLFCQQSGILPQKPLYVPDNRYKDYIKYNSYKLPKSDILFISSTYFLVESDNQVFDRIMDDFVQIKADVTSKMLRHETEFNYEKLSSMGIPFSTDNFIYKMIKYGAERQEVSSKDIEAIDALINYLKDTVPFEVEEGLYAGVKQRALTVIKEFPFYYKYYQTLIDIVQPKLMISDGGLCGLPMVKVFNDCGVTTAEYQHGQINLHFDYMYGASIAESEVCKGLMPQYLLTWGSFWTKGQKMPTNIYRLGNPAVQKEIEKFRKLEPDTNAQYRILLIVGVEHNWYVDFIRYILEHLPANFKIIVKLHPSLPETLKYYKPFLSNDRVEVKIKGWIYGYFAMCKYVIGDMSTAMYEAAAVGKEVFIADNKIADGYMNGGFGIKIKNGQEFVERMNEIKEESFCSEDFFENNWKDNYLNFLREVGLF